MVFAVNPTADKTFEQFQAAAMGGTASASNTSSTGSVAGVAPVTDSLPGVASATNSLPGVAGSVTSAPSQSGFVTVAATGTGTGTAASVPVASSSTTANGAIRLSSVGSALSLVSIFAAVAGFML